MEKKKICSVCNTENREDFQFCKNCGARLPEALNTEPEQQASAAEVQDAPTAPTEPEKTTPPFYAPAQNKAEMSELDTLSAFIGTNGYSYAQKLLNMKSRYKKASWNWPVFLFGFLLGLPFVWFYYRKMYKQGTIILLVSLAIVLSSSACISGFLSPIFDAVTTLGYAYSSSADNQDSTFIDYHYANDSDWLDEEFERRFEEGFRNGLDDDLADEDTDAIMSILAPKLPQMLFCMLAIFILALLNLIFIILLAVYADHMFKNHCERKIALLKSSGRCDAFALRNAGGTSTASAVVSGILYSVGVGIISCIIIFSSMSSLFQLIMLMD